MKTYGVCGTTEDGAEVREYPLTSRMDVMAPHTHVEPPEAVSPSREACERAFALACRYSRGRDLVEEIMASNYWPLSKDNPPFRLEMVKILVFGPEAGIPFPPLRPVFGRGRNGGQFRLRG